MCGISGIWQKNSDSNELKEAISKMNQSQFYRGPDDGGIFIDEENGVALGHRRLAILDLSEAGKQPMIYQHQSAKTNVNQQLIITFNGEIYNFLELKKDLVEKGYNFKTKTDTEVILALYAEYGVKSFEMLRGMFAFGLWDKNEQKLFLVKDRFGIKPLYYYNGAEKLVFASTVKAIAKSNLISIKKNQDALIGFLLFGFVPLPLTTIKDVLAVPAGHYLEISVNGEQKIIKYYDILDAFLNKSKDSFEKAISNVKNLLNNSIGYHLISDAPLGVFLSGGLDSSAIAAFAAKQRSNPITTLSIIFNEKEFSEQKYQRLVAQKIGSEHKEIKIIKKDFEKNFDEIFEAMDQPTIDGVNTFFIAKAAKEIGLKAVLSGLGADEIFMGYPSFRKAAALKKIQNAVSIFGHRKSLGFMMSLILNLLDDKFQKIGYFFDNSPLSFYLGIRGLFTPREAANILNINIKEVNNFIKELSRLHKLNDERIKQLDPVNLLSYLELKFYLQSQLLKDVDFISMKHSIEVRVPFLDHKLVGYLSSLSPELKLNIKDIKKNINKPLLVESVRDLLPQEIFMRPKMGFTLPFQKWLKKKGKFNRGSWSRFWAKEVLTKF